MSLRETLVKLALKRYKIAKNPVASEFESVCFLSNTAIGDTLFNTPFFREFKRLFPHKKAIAVFDPSNASLFETNPYLDEIIRYDGRWNGFFAAVKALKKAAPDVCLILHSNEPQATPLAVFAGAKYIYKIPDFGSDFARWHSNEPMKYGEIDYVPLKKLEYMRFLGAEASGDTRLELFLKGDEFAAARTAIEYDSNLKYVGIQMGASTVHKQWFLESWITLGKKLLADGCVKIVLTGSPSERGMAEELERALGSERVLNMAGKMNLRGSAALVGCLDLLITPDTGPLHVAAALGVPTVCFFGPTPSKGANPNFDVEIHKFIQKPKTCEPCISKKCKNPKCMLQITPEDVYAMARELLDNSNLKGEA